MPTLIQDDTVNVIVNENSTNITVGILGVQGVAGGGSSNDAGIIILSGNLYQTGINLYNLITGVSGQTQSNSCSSFNSVFLYNHLVTGFNEIKVTGYNNNQFLVIGDAVESVQCSGNLITSIGINITGFTGDIVSQIQSTGETLNNKINSLSGYSNNFFVDRVNNQYITGEKSFMNQISGDILKINYFLMKDYSDNSYRQVYLSGNNIYMV